jgi:hypothetical protein
MLLPLAPEILCISILIQDIDFYKPEMNLERAQFISHDATSFVHFTVFLRRE